MIVTAYVHISLAIATAITGGLGTRSRLPMCGVVRMRVEFFRGPAFGLSLERSKNRPANQNDPGGQERPIPSKLRSGTGIRCDGARLGPEDRFMRADRGRAECTDKSDVAGLMECRELVGRQRTESGSVRFPWPRDRADDELAIGNLSGTPIPVTVFFASNPRGRGRASGVARRISSRALMMVRTRPAPCRSNSLAAASVTAAGAATRI